MSNRQAYNKLQAEERRRQTEALQAFKAANPKRYIELQETARQELSEETPTAPTIVFTGELSITRDAASKLAEKAGFKVSNHVSKNTTYVVVGENPGSKLQRAIQLNSEILNEDDFHTVLKGEKPSHSKAAICKSCGHKLSEQMARYARMYGGFTCLECHTINRF